MVLKTHHNALTVQLVSIALVVRTKPQINAMQDTTVTLELTKQISLVLNVLRATTVLLALNFQLPAQMVFTPQEVQLRKVTAKIA